jgi:uncharacterized protein
MKDFEHDYPDHTQAPDFEHGDEAPSNTSANPTFYEIAETRYAASRRDVMVGGLAAFIGGMIGTSLTGRAAMAATTSTEALMGFTPVPVSTEDTVVVPEGYRVTTVLKWGEPISGDMPEFRPDNTGEEQGHQIGQHHDGQHFFPIEGDDPFLGSSAEGIYCVNHEYVDPRFLHSAAYAGNELRDGEVMVEADGTRPDDHVLKEMNAHGVSVVRIAEQSFGEWEIVRDDRNRRITALTPMEIGGPVRGYHKVRTKYSPDGTMTRGTINNCAHGVTPWNTYLTCEENWAGYFVNKTQYDQKPDLPREHSRYGVRTDRSRYGWELAASGADEYVRFDASETGADATEDYRNEPNGFGWVVEIDPWNPASVPVKRTHLGRFAHEGVVFAQPEPGHPVVAYAGDDARFEYIYKFVSDALYVRAKPTARPLIRRRAACRAVQRRRHRRMAGAGAGTQGAADGRKRPSRTRPTSWSTRALPPTSAGATKMDRPEWGAIDPHTGEVYFTLTNNTRRTEAQVDPSNPRAGNQFGQIIRWRENRDDPAATGFAWDLFVIAGDDHQPHIRRPGADEDNIFACPDGLWFDQGGRLWIQTDMARARSTRAIWSRWDRTRCSAPIRPRPRSGAS